MYTQCPDCATVFRLTADALRAAQGNVRCGVCSTTFNALENLSEKPFRSGPDDEDAPGLEDTITVEEQPGTENIELWTPPETSSTSEPGTERETAGESPAEEQSFEFNGDVDDLDRLFVEMPATELQHMAAVARTRESPRVLTIDPGVIAASLSISEDADTKMVPNDAERLRDDDERTDEHPILILDESDDVVVPLRPARAPAPAPAPVPQRKPREFQPDPFEAPRVLIPDEMRKSLAEEAAVSALAAPEFDDFEPEVGRRRWPWGVGVACLTLVLVAQVVHGQRNELIQKPAIGPLLAQIYSLVGLPFAEPTDLAAYELRQWGAASDTAQPGRLLLRASIVNRASYAQPYPLLRLALQDRFGTTVGALDIEPVDYLPGSGVGDLREPGQRADAEIRIVDPGKDAVGFEMDVCLSTADAVRCANEAQPAAQ